MREPLKNYQVDLDDVWHVIQHDLTPLKEQIEEYLAEIDNNV